MERRDIVRRLAPGLMCFGLLLLALLMWGKAAEGNYCCEGPCLNSEVTK